MTDISQQTLASIVTAHRQVVPVLEKYSLDFCCKGKRTLADACADKGLNLQEVASELESTFTISAGKKMPFGDMTAEQLINYILINHHFYVRQSMPNIHLHLEKVALKHGDKFPYMKQVAKLFSEIQSEMTAHMEKEETILFPRIKEAERIFKSGDNASFTAGYLEKPIAVMESEHDLAGETLFEIRSLTNNYTPPVEACTTFIVSLAELKAFEEDLHKHVHLENNILFPKAKTFILR